MFATRTNVNNVKENNIAEQREGGRWTSNVHVQPSRVAIGMVNYWPPGNEVSHPQSSIPILVI